MTSSPLRRLLLFLGVAVAAGGCYPFSQPDEESAECGPVRERQACPSIVFSDFPVQSASPGTIQASSSTRTFTVRGVAYPGALPFSSLRVRNVLSWFQGRLRGDFVADSLRGYAGPVPFEFAVEGLTEEFQVVEVRVENSLGYYVRDRRLQVRWVDSTDPGNDPPTVTVNQPLEGASFETGEQVEFRGEAFDPEDGSLDALIEWSSSIDGSLGTGPSLDRTLSSGVHRIVARVTDADGASAADSVSVEVADDEAVVQLGLSVGASPDSAAVGDTINLSATLRHLAGGAAAGAVRVRTQPSGPVEYLDHVTAGGASYDSGTGEWQVPGVPQGDSVGLTIRVLASDTGTATHSARITAGAAADDDPSDNQDTVTVLVTEPPAPSAAIFGTVTVDALPYQDLRVVLSGDASQERTPDAAAGAYSFSGLAAGSYTVRLEDISGVTFPDTAVSVALSVGEVVQVDFVGQSVRPSGRISGTVTVNGAPYSDLNVVLNGAREDLVLPDTLGTYAFDSLPAGNYTVAVDGYTGVVFADSAFNVVLAEGDSAIVDFSGTGGSGLNCSNPTPPTAGTIQLLDAGFNPISPPVPEFTDFYLTHDGFVDNVGAGLTFWWDSSWGGPGTTPDLSEVGNFIRVDGRPAATYGAYVRAFDACHNHPNAPPGYDGFVDATLIYQVTN